ncbi:MAG: hypothetical protein EPO31_03100 [Gammaproteobacteria bacterium]|nr:MAG: hypothetical protein EPO31_03100 [Gammaproteobacteria bacterium]
MEELKNLKKTIIESFREAMEFKAFTDLSYLFATNFVQIPGSKIRIVLGHSQYGGAVGLSDQEVTSADLPNHFSTAKNNYFFSLIHQQQVSLFESLFFDVIRILLSDRPERLSKKKQIDYESIFSSDTKEEIIWKLIDRELNEIKYKNVVEWFDYLNKMVTLPEIDSQDIEKISEAKAARDILVHNSGIINQIYINKSGGSARFTIGQKIDVSGDYTRDIWQLFVELLVTIVDSIIRKCEQEST